MRIADIRRIRQSIPVVAVAVAVDSSPTCRNIHILKTLNVGVSGVGRAIHSEGEGGTPGAGIACCTNRAHPNRMGRGRAQTCEVEGIARIGRKFIAVPFHQVSDVTSGNIRPTDIGFIRRNRSVQACGRKTSNRRAGSRAGIADIAVRKHAAVCAFVQLQSIRINHGEGSLVIIHTR